MLHYLSVMCTFTAPVLYLLQLQLDGAVCVYVIVRKGKSERARRGERERGQCGPHCSNISKFADASSACQAWDSSGSRISHTYMPHSQAAWHSFHKHTCPYSIIQFIEAHSHHRRRPDSDMRTCHGAVTWPALGCYDDALSMSIASMVKYPTAPVSPTVNRHTCGRGMWSFIILLTVATGGFIQETWLREYLLYMRHTRQHYVSSIIHRLHFYSDWQQSVKEIEGNCISVWASWSWKILHIVFSRK